MDTALFVNGVYETVLTEILKAQAAREGGESFLQPYKGQVITILKERLPTPSSPIRLYISTTEKLSNICYTAEIVKWEDKRKMSPSRRDEVLHQLEKFQQKECDLFLGKELAEGKAINLITVCNLRGLETLPATSFLIKKSDGLPLGKRTRAGGWSEVYDYGDLTASSIPATETEETSRRKLVSEIAKAKSFDADTLQQRLKTASKIPERVLIVSVGYRRNADVIVATLNRANGICERCGKNAPFVRKSDGTPFLEIHHRITLAEGGEDTVENAVALCPNCHRETHYG